MHQALGGRCIFEEQRAASVLLRRWQKLFSFGPIEGASSRYWKPSSFARRNVLATQGRLSARLARGCSSDFSTCHLWSVVLFWILICQTNLQDPAMVRHAGPRADRCECTRLYNGTGSFSHPLETYQNMKAPSKFTHL